MPASVHALTPFDYRGPDQLPDGGVLVVGASATGVQLAWEIQRSGRPVTLAVGEHVRLPRPYRGRDVLWWMDAAGIWNQRYDEIDDLTRARRLPSPQLVGTPERGTLDLNVLSGAGVTLVGRLAAIRDGRALFSGGLRNLFALADLKMERLLDSFDEWARTQPAAGEVGTAGALRADGGAGVVADRPRPRERRDPDRSSGRPASIRTTAGSTCPSSIARGSSATTAAPSSTRPACMRLACRCCAGASRPSFMEPKTTPGTSSRIWCLIWRGSASARKGSASPDYRLDYAPLTRGRS